MITPEQARAELERRRQAPAAAPPTEAITPDQARAELDRRKNDAYRMEQRNSSGIGAGISSAANQFTAGFLDEGISGLQTGFGAWGDWDKEWREDEAQRQIRHEESPIATTVGGGIGAVAGGLGAGLAARGAIKALSPRLARKAARNPGKYGVGLGAAEGAVAGAGNAGPDESRITGALVGAGAGGVGGGIGGALANRAARKQLAKTTSEIDATSAGAKKEASGIYDDITESGGRVAPRAVADLNNRLNATTVEMGLDETGIPNKINKAVFKKFNEYAENPSEFTHKKVMALKDEISEATGKAKGKTRRRLGRYKATLDKWAGELPDADVIDDAGRTIKNMPKADKLYHKANTLKDIENIVQSASLANDPNSAMKTGMASLSRKIQKNATYGKRFSRRQKKMIEELATAKNIPGLMQFVKNMTPSTRNTMYNSTGNAGMAVGYGLVGGLPALAGGLAADKATHMAQSAMVNKLLRALLTDVADPRKLNRAARKENVAARKSYRIGASAGAAAGAASGGNE